MYIFQSDHPFGGYATYYMQHIVNIFKGQSDVNNPFASCVMPNYKFWSPWVGQKSRKSKHLYNTEYKKCHHNTNVSEKGTSPVSLDEIIAILDEGSVSCQLFEMSLSLDIYTWDP